MEDIKAMLLQKKKEIMEDLEQEHNLTLTSVTNDIGDSIDHASEERERELHQILHDRDRVKLLQIRQALDRIESNTYGQCEDCGEKISKKRLMALPFTQLCIACKTEEEKFTGKGMQYDSPAPDFSDVPSNEMDS